MLRIRSGRRGIPALHPAEMNLGTVAGEFLSNLVPGLVQFADAFGPLLDLALA
ncbi:MAG: hypothetical protein AVDCRST_MAG19-1029 [uncultured Thermomicrobiales bacterium]|uniref:Uncharacterized protein n=1 Tax=uncultured Thermomicrobiales bacterium TaxID=1645740 RepID=A0A6J4UKN6_9BACT|nr:MAG: hypothetical protein AVDCRST_MAG19-1029 [uncultured Thermomicrobiales bacterium]